MKLCRRLAPDRRLLAGSVLTIGNFDGVHLGHRAIVAEVVRTAAERGLCSALLCFEPQPQEHFDPLRAPARIMRWREKYRALAPLGLDYLVLLGFDARLAAIEAEDFVARWLVGALGMRHLVVGDDFCFGRGRRGDYGLLEALAPRHGYTLARAPSHQQDGLRVSSTRVREALSAGDFAGAARLLGAPWRATGHVVQGDRIGRTLGFPTANLRHGRHRLPVSGICTARVAGLGGTPLPAVAYLGRRPAVGGTREVLEVHLLDWSGDCYGRRLEVEFIARLREDRHFADLAALREQMMRDVAAARASFAPSAPAATRGTH